MPGSCHQRTSQVIDHAGDCMRRNTVYAVKSAQQLSFIGLLLSHILVDSYDIFAHNHSDILVVLTGAKLLKAYRGRTVCTLLMSYIIIEKETTFIGGMDLVSLRSNDKCWYIFQKRVTYPLRLSQRSIESFSNTSYQSFRIYYQATYASLLIGMILVMAQIIGIFASRTQNEAAFTCCACIIVNTFESNMTWLQYCFWFLWDWLCPYIM